MTNEERRQRINLSVDVLEERLAQWAARVQDSIDSLRADLRLRDDRFDNQISGLLLWKAAHEIEYRTLKDQVDRQEKDIKDLKDATRDQSTARRVTGSVLKSQWTWISAGVLFLSTLIGIAVNLTKLPF